MTVAPKQVRGTAVGRPGDGPLSGTFEIVDARRDGVYRVLTVLAPEIAARSHPGQFVEVGVRGQSTLLRRPFSIAAVDGAAGRPGTVTVVFDVHGPGTEWLAEQPVNTLVDVVGPLGNSFPIPKQSVNAMLVAGGYGAAPLFWLGEQLRRSGMRVDMINGAATHARIHGAVLTKQVSRTATFTTDDGSFGVQGRVTDVLAERIEECGSGVVYTVGPMAMLRAVAEICDELGVACQVAVEEHMACGVGVCWTCVVPVRTADGGVAHRRACLDGPVFDGAAISWEASRWAPPAPTVADEPEPPARPTSQELFG